MYDIPHIISIDAIGRKKSIFVLFSFKFSLFSLTEILDTKYAIKKKITASCRLIRKYHTVLSDSFNINIKSYHYKEQQSHFVMRVIDVRRIEVNIA